MTSEESKWQPDLDDIRFKITDKTRAIVIINPNNPCGVLYDEKKVKAIADLAGEYDIPLISDEIYDQITYEKKFVSTSYVAKDVPVIGLNGFSKTYLMTGWRLGYVITNEELINQILKINQHIITCPSTILEYYIAKHFDEIIRITKPQIKKVVMGRAKVCEYLNSKGLDYFEGDAAWYIFLSIEKSKLTSDEFCTELLKKHHVCCVPGIGYGKTCDKFIRVCVGSEPWNRVTKGIDIIKNLIDDTS